MKAILIPVAVILVSLVILTIMVVSRINLNKKSKKRDIISIANRYAYFKHNHQ